MKTVEILGLEIRRSGRIWDIQGLDGPRVSFTDAHWSVDVSGRRSDFPATLSDGQLFGIRATTDEEEFEGFARVRVRQVGHGLSADGIELRFEGVEPARGLTGLAQLATASMDSAGVGSS